MGVLILNRRTALWEKSASIRPRRAVQRNDEASDENQKREELTDDGSSESIATIKTNTIAASRSVDFDLSGVWLEALGGVLGGDAALEGEATDGDAVLGEAKLFERCAGGNLNLRRDDIDAGDLFGDGVFDLTKARLVSSDSLQIFACSELSDSPSEHSHSGVDFDKVVTVLLVDQKLGRTSISVVGGLG